MVVTLVSPLTWMTAARPLSDTAGLFVAAVLALLGGLFQVNPVWVYGPFDPSVVSAPAQPDWYLGWLEGALRLAPPFEFRILGKLDLPPNPRIALVGTPCEVEGLKAMQARPWVWGSAVPDAVVLTVALLCTKSFNYEKLMVDEIRRKRGIALEDIGRVDVVKGKLIVQDHQRETLISEPIRDFHGAALKGCDECTDFLGGAADLSVGSVGSDDGWSSVLVRTTAGKAAVARAKDRLELRDLERPQALEKLDALDKKVAFEHLERPFDPHAPLFIDYTEHVNAYDGTDRAPVSRGR